MTENNLRSEQIGTRVSPDVKEKLIEDAKKMGHDIGPFVRFLLEKYVSLTKEQKRTFFFPDD